MAVNLQTEERYQLLEMMRKLQKQQNQIEVLMNMVIEDQSHEEEEEGEVKKRFETQKKTEKIENKRERQGARYLFDSPETASSSESSSGSTDGESEALESFIEDKGSRRIRPGNSGPMTSKMEPKTRLQKQQQSQVQGNA